MATLTYRLVKGSELTYAELDGNFTTLNTAKLELGQAQASGAANGLVYLNASKQVAMATGLTFDGVGLFSLTKNSQASIVQSASDTQAVIRAGNSAGAVTDLNAMPTYGELRTASNHPLLFSINLIEQMRLTSTGLGIGTSSPATKLQVNAAAPAIRIQETTTGGDKRLELGVTAAGQAYIGANQSAQTLQFETVGSTRMTLDASGNLGIGVTPSAWSSYKPLQAGTGASFGGYAGDVLTFVGSNAYNDGTNWRYIVSGNAAARYQQDTGAHKWHIAPSGTAGNTITFTQAMTLDTSGNLLVGLTGALANGKLQIAGGIGLSGNTQIRQATNSDGNTLQVFATQLVASNTNAGSYTYAGGGLLASVAAGDGVLLLDSGRLVSTDGRLKLANSSSGNVALSLEKSGSTILYIDTGSGNLGIGMVPSAWSSSLRVLQIAGNAALSSVVGTDLTYNAYFDGTNWRYAGSTTAARYSQFATGGSHAWFTAASGTAGAAITFTQAMTLDASGNLLIGTATANATRLTVAGPVALQSPSSVNAATYTVAVADSALRFTTTNCTVTLPAAASFPGRIIWLSTITANSVISASANVVPLGSSTAGTAILAATAGKFAVLQSDGTNWLTILAN